MPLTRDEAFSQLCAWTDTDALVFVFAIAFLGEEFRWQTAAGAALCAGGAALMAL